MPDPRGPETGWRGKPPSEITIDLVIPVFNEAHVLEASLRRVHRFLTERVPHRWQIVMAENGSTDDTLAVGRRLCQELGRVDVVVLDRPGRGRALREAWGRSTADIVCYTDVDLSTELDALPRMFRALIEGEYDIAVASRLMAGSRTTRSLRRQVISRIYNWLLRRTLHVSFTDAQTGCKALTREVVRKVLPLVENDAWFLDSELLVLAEKLGYRIADLPVVWVEDNDSRVRILSTAWEDIRGIVRLRRRLRHPERREFTAARSRPSGESLIR